MFDNRWFEKFGVTHGTTAEDWISKELSRKELTPFFGLSDEELESEAILAIFLGYYFSWDVETSLRIAKENGFKVRKEGPKTGYFNYSDIDDDFISIHHWLKWYKFGFTRTWDNLAIEIRNKRITRKRAIAILSKLEDETPYEDIKKFCIFLGIKMKVFFEICEQFRNKEIWIRDSGIWKIRDFLIPSWRWK